MKHKNEKRTIAYMLCISILLLTLGLYTAFASVSLANPTRGPIKYDVYFTEVGTNNKVMNNVIVTNNRIDLSMLFKEYGEELIAYTSLNNDGNIDTKIDKLLKTNLNDIEVGESDKTGNVYTLADYLSFRVYYANDNEKNNIKAINNVVENDIIKGGTNNNIVIKVALKNEDQLTEDQKHVFKKLRTIEVDNKLYNALDVDLYIEVICLEA